MAWLPAVKVLLPYVGQIITATLPVFNKKAPENADSVNQSQITELQDAVVENAKSLKLMANQLQELIIASDGSATKVRKEMLFIKWLSITAILISIGSVILWVSTRT